MNFSNRLIKIEDIFGHSTSTDSLRLNILFFTAIILLSFSRHLREIVIACFAISSFFSHQCLQTNIFLLSFIISYFLFTSVLFIMMRKYIWSFHNFTAIIITLISQYSTESEEYPKTFSFVISH